MKCPICQQDDHGDISQTTTTTRGVFRRRRCASCKVIYSTLERPTNTPYPWEVRRHTNRDGAHQEKPIDT